MPFGLGSSSSKKLNGSPSSSSQGSVSLALKNKITVLIVDDNKVNRMIHQMLLTNLGVYSQEVENGQEAVDLHVSGASFDLILMDNEMPVMNGPQTTRKLREMGIRCKIVGLSGNSRERDIKEFMAAGLDDYYSKPITRPKLVPLLQEIDNAKTVA